MFSENTSYISKIEYQIISELQPFYLCFHENFYFSVLERWSFNKSVVQLLNTKLI